MGMYTELYMGVSLKKDTPPKVVETIKAIIAGKAGYEHRHDHAFFATDRWGWCLRSGGSYYFDAAPHARIFKDDIDGHWRLTFGTNIKNYSEEWEKFIDWIRPFIETKGHLGHIRYEEQSMPTILFMNLDGTIGYITTCHLLPGGAA